MAIKTPAELKALILAAFTDNDTEIFSRRLRAGFSMMR